MFEKAGEVAGDLTKALEAQKAARGYAPDSFDFDQAKWAMIGKVLARVLVAGIRCGLSGAQFIALSVIALKVLGLSRKPQGRLSTASIAQTIGKDRKTAQRALERLCGEALIDVERDETRAVTVCRLHRSIFVGEGDSAIAPGALL